MDFSSNQSEEEARIIERKLYRPGQNQSSADKTSTPAPSSSRSAGKSAASAAAPARGASAAKHGANSSGGSPKDQRILISILTLGIGYYLLYGTPTQKRRARVGLGMAAWMLLLGAISYSLCIPSVDEAKRRLAAIREDSNLTPEERREKFGEVMRSLTETQKQGMAKEWAHKRNKDMSDFLKMTPEEQMEQVKKEQEQWKRFRQEWANRQRAQGGTGGGTGGAGGAGGRPGGGAPRGGGGGGGFRGGPGGGPGGVSDVSSPEARAGQVYKGGLMGQLNEKR